MVLHGCGNPWFNGFFFVFICLLIIFWSLSASFVFGLVGLRHYRQGLIWVCVLNRCILAQIFEAQMWLALFDAWNRCPDSSNELRLLDSNRLLLVKASFIGFSDLLTAKCNRFVQHLSHEHRQRRLYTLLILQHELLLFLNAKDRFLKLSHFLLPFSAERWLLKLVPNFIPQRTKIHLWGSVRRRPR